MNIHTLPLGAYQTNCYILYSDDRAECLVIDPGYEPELVLARIRELGKEPEAVLLTHGHFDHVGGVKLLAAETDCRVYLNPADCSMPPQFTAGQLYYTHSYGDGDVLTLAGLQLRVLGTPGHTPGSVCLITEDAIFSGDTLFEGSCGRTDLPGGDTPIILGSLARLGQLEGEYRVYPGHGPSTRLSKEKRFNPYMRGIV